MTEKKEPKNKGGRPKGLPSFSRVDKARDLLASKAEKIVKDLMVASEVASKKGDSRPAEFILTHITVTDDQGKEHRPLSSSIDKQLAESGPSGPTIQIGFLLPGMQMPSNVKVIDVTPVGCIAPVATLPSPSESHTLERKPEESLVIDGESDNGSNDN